ncbi:cellulose synthase catalytic subunit [Parafrankia sp. FMc6]|uniref:glycosyltransferase family 2 protein n=1 Tax=Parafrankia soli TaxID=2599596 RepID=UPI0034D63447
MDIFLPSAGETIGMLKNTYQHVAQLNWPGTLRVYVLDDSARTYVAGLAAARGFTYLSRPNRGYLKKAGNLRYGYQQSTGDFILVLDADFAPRPDFLHELMPYMDDPSVGIVQSPQFFDVGGKFNFNWLQRSAGATQELFYRWIQPARDGRNAAICVGTNAIYRRAGLQKSGGFAQIGHSEDVHTGVNLIKVGYRIQYVPVNVAKGVCPDAFDGFTNQQYRWCTGSMSLLVDRKFHQAPLKFGQRLCYWTGFLYYISTALITFTGPLPGLTMLWVFPEDIRPANYIPLVGVVAIWAILMPAVTGGRWRPDVIRVQILIGFCHALAIADILRGRTAAWVPTGAAKKTPVYQKVARLIRWWGGFTFVAIWAGVSFDITRFGWDQYWTTVLFALPSLYFMFPLLLPGHGVHHPEHDMTMDIPYLHCKPVQLSLDTTIHYHLRPPVWIEQPTITIVRQQRSVDAPTMNIVLPRQTGPWVDTLAGV